MSIVPQEPPHQAPRLHATLDRDAYLAVGAMKPRGKARSEGATAYIWADMLTLRQHVPTEAPVGGRRGKCQGFSAASRRRLIHKLATLHASGFVINFTTLTYPKDYILDPVVWKEHLQSWAKRLGRAFGEKIAGFVWRIEFQKRGAPHYHLMVWTNGLNTRLFRAWALRAWYEVVGSGDVKHLKHGAHVKELDSRRAIRNYVSKYLGKVVPTGSNDEGEAIELLEWGRNWGVRGDIPADPYHERQLSAGEFYSIRRLVRRWLKSRRSNKFADWCSEAYTLRILGLGAESSISGEVVVAMLSWACEEPP